MIEATDKRLYTGITTNIERRFDEHASGKTGAKFFRGRKPEKILYVEDGHDRSTASRREREIKSMRRADKLKLIETSRGEP